MLLSQYTFRCVVGMIMTIDVTYITDSFHLTEMVNQLIVPPNHISISLDVVYISLRTFGCAMGSKFSPILSQYIMDALLIDCMWWSRWDIGEAVYLYIRVYIDCPAHSPGLAVWKICLISNSQTDCCYFLI